MPKYVILLLLAYSLAISAQGRAWDPAIIARANTAGNAAYLSAEEKKVILYVNLVRLDPKLFAETYLKHYLDSAGDNNSYTKSLLKTLLTTPAMGALSTDEVICRFSKDHAIRSGKENKIGHANFKDRIKEIKKNYGGYFAENCDYGNEKAFDIVLGLLIDEGVQSLGHRKNILNPVYKSIGVSIKPHKGYKWNCVMNLGA
ncbi:MAG TPA: CAP domain-containing protein [Bacteroidia bacterium]|jgi:uncharacterized protein YkwD